MDLGVSFYTDFTALDLYRPVYRFRFSIPEEAGEPVFPFQEHR